MIQNPEIAKLIKAEDRYKALANSSLSVMEKTKLLTGICSEYDIAYKGFIILEGRLIK